MSPDEIDIAGLRAAYRRCFGCGLDNTHGLRIDGFAIIGSTVTAPFTPRSEFVGFDGILHGGIVATALDEISAWSGMLTQGVFVYTAKLDIRYRRQADLDNEFFLSGAVVERRGRRLTINAELYANGETAAESKGLFVVAQDIESAL